MVKEVKRGKKCNGTNVVSIRKPAHTFLLRYAEILIHLLQNVHIGGIYYLYEILVQKISRFHTFISSLRIIFDIPEKLN